jgi:hypothetical protein
MTTPSAHDSFAQSKDRFNKYCAEWQFMLTNFPGLFKELQELGIEVDFNRTDGCIDIRFTGDQGLMRKAWRAIRSYQFEPDNRPEADKPLSSFSTFWRRKFLQGVKQDGSPDQRDLRLWYYFSSNVCKTVQVGTKMVEQPIYEVKCE